MKIKWMGIVFLSALAALQMPALGQSNPGYLWRNLAGRPPFYDVIDGTGTNAWFLAPNSIAVDGAGNIYVADAGHIRMVTYQGVVTTLALTYGTNAPFEALVGIAVDRAGNIYAPDGEAATLRKVTPQGVVMTLAGSPGMPGTNDGTGAAARFNGPSAAAVDGAGNIYVTDAGNHTIRKVTSTGVVTTLAGTPGQAGTNDGTGAGALFDYPAGIAIDKAGNIYVADEADEAIRKVTSTGVVTTFAGTPGQWGTNDGPAGVAEFKFPDAVAVDDAGNVYATDRMTVRKIDQSGVVTTIGGNGDYSGFTDGVGMQGLFDFPLGIAVDHAGRLFVADSGNCRITEGTLGPGLNLAPSSNGLVVSWPSPYTGFTLQQNSDAANLFTWTAPSYATNDDGTNKSVTVPLSSGNLFFRLVGQ